MMTASSFRRPAPAGGPMGSRGALAGLAIMAESSRPVYGEPYNAVPAYAPQEVYIEGQPEAGVPPANPASAWYYCASSAMYYPYTKACPEGWQAVPAHPY